MKIELKREEPKESFKRDESKEAIGDQALAVEQVLPVEEEEDTLQPYYEYLTPTEIEAFSIIDTVCVQNKYLTRENILLQEHIITLRSVIQRLEYLLSLKEKDEPSTTSPSLPSSSRKETWVHGMGITLGLCQAWGRCFGIVSPPLSLLLSIFSSILSYVLI